MSQAELRLSDTERDQAAATLGEHFSVGRLTTDEHAERLDAVWTARTRADLVPIFEDLPPAHGARTTAARAPLGSALGAGPRRFHPMPFLPIVLVLIVLSAITHLPFWLGIAVVGCVLFTRRAGIRRTRGWA